MDNTELVWVMVGKGLELPTGLPKLVTKMGFGRLRIQCYQSWIWSVKNSELP